jgi:aryl-alcohol dehydrogenase-like predicted oxidoreductase
MSETTLQQNSLGRTDLSVTKLGYGAMEVRGHGSGAGGLSRTPRLSRS